MRSVRKASQQGAHCPAHPQGCRFCSLCLHFSLSLEATDLNYLLSAVSARPEPHSQAQHLPASPKQTQLDSDKDSSVPLVFDGVREDLLSQPVAFPAWGPRESGGIPHPSQPQQPLGEQSLWLALGLHADFQGSGHPHYLSDESTCCATLSQFPPLSGPHLFHLYSEGWG